MSKKVYTNAEVNAALRAALDEKGEDYVYDSSNGCRYEKEGGPSCLVGYVIHKLDPDAFQRVVEFENDHLMNKGDNSFSNVASSLRLPFDYDQRRALEMVQSAQDRGASWGRAVAEEWIAALGEQL